MMIYMGMDIWIYGCGHDNCGDDDDDDTDDDDDNYLSCGTFENEYPGINFRLLWLKENYYW